MNHHIPISAEGRLVLETFDDAVTADRGWTAVAAAVGLDVQVIR